MDGRPSSFDQLGKTHYGWKLVLPSRRSVVDNACCARHIGTCIMSAGRLLCVGTGDSLSALKMHVPMCRAQHCPFFLE